MSYRNIRRIFDRIKRHRTAIIYFALALIFSGVLQKGESYSLSLLSYTISFWIYAYVEMCKKYHRPRRPDLRANLKVITEPNVDWAITTVEGELIVSGWGSRNLELPSNKTYIDRNSKVKYSEYVYVAEVLSENGDAFVSLTIDEDVEFAQTVACGSSGDPEVLYTSVNTGYGTRHWLLPGFLQGIPR